MLAYPPSRRAAIVAKSRPIRAVGFDWDETLFAIDRESPGYYTTMAEYALRAMQLPIDWQQDILCHDHIHHFETETNHTSADLRRLSDALAKTLGADAETFHTAFAEHYIESRTQPEFLRARHAHMLPGALDTLQFLQQHHIPFFIASNSPQSSVRKLVKQLVVDANGEPLLSDAEINRVVLGTHAGLRRKPEKDMLDEGFSAVGIDAPDTRCFYIGNSIESDVIAAVRAGVRPILFTGVERAVSETPSELNVRAAAHTAGTAYHAHARRAWGPHLNGEALPRDADGRLLRHRRALEVHPVSFTLDGRERYCAVPTVYDHAELKALMQRRLMESLAPEKKTR